MTWLAYYKTDSRSEITDRPRRDICKETDRSTERQTYKKPDKQRSYRQALTVSPRTHLTADVSLGAAITPFRRFILKEPFQLIRLLRDDWCVRDRRMIGWKARKTRTDRRTWAGALRLSDDRFSSVISSSCLLGFLSAVVLNLRVLA